MKYFLFVTTLGAFLNTALIQAESKAVTGAKEDFQSFKKEMDNSLDKIDQDINELKEKTKDKGSKVKEQTVEEAKSARAKIEAELAELKGKSKENWSKAKKEISASVDSLSKKIQAALE